MEPCHHVIYGKLTATWVEDMQIQYDYENDDDISIMSTAACQICKIVFHIWKKSCDFKYRKIDQAIQKYNSYITNNNQTSMTWEDYTLKYQ